jgi:4-amino-4-deoxy-L-arabinose transferase-like glycosyltransferase
MIKIKSFTRKSCWLNPHVTATVLIIKALVLLFIAQSHLVTTDQPIDKAYWFLDVLNRWDAQSFLRIAQYGYEAQGKDAYRIVFLPFYPALITLFRIVFRDYVLSSVIVSAVATLVLGLSFRQLVKLDYSEKTAQLAVLYLFIFPTSYFLHLPYSESLFLALAISCFIAARKRLWLAVGILGALACLTRVNGLILIPALAFEVWEEHRETKKTNRSWLFLALIPMGFGIYMAINYFVTGDPVKFLFYQRENFGRHFDLPWHGIKGTYDRISSPKPVDSQMYGFQELSFVALGLFATLIGWRYLRNSYRVWMALNWLLFISTSFVLSVPRYTLIMFPMFILMARVSLRNWWVKVLLIGWSVLYLSIFTAQFARGWWAF